PAGTRRWLRGGDFGPWVLAVVVDGDVVAMARDPLTGGGLVSLGRDPLTGSARWLLADGRLLHIGDLAEIEAVVEPVGAGMPAA
ncbi:MAG TPA: hypothetical protein VKV06_00990, partial [Acidimicrobiales bacterium]|nr:hypothetical protein [Acidimicrobiales bacterium]